MSGKETEQVYDIRVLERNVRKGVIARKDVERYLKALPDRADNVAPMDDDDAHSSHGGNNVSTGG